ncbi:aldolase/citrate lyase family protein [Phyllobacterium sp. 21LDTY02-6]|uniref:HpcH/HpaI aldolase family protein n=1 Tax=Phyllobacterium sp. 21LDTY02-6 TaxID=2944903 RepID=UPI0020205BC9|nr:aldolase/citrate lyase family protein [Phyllobacterium sp. 21LDTY02-6]MCO4319080.1 aldolase/citrate lyase family protein [Phyllobacterium sp. 21LDTY02-6]
MTYRDNSMKARLVAGEKVLGCWTSSGSPVVTELLSLAGYDYLLIDQEHGVGDNLSLIGQLQAMANNPATAIVRVPWNDHVMIKRALDAGAEGIMIPSVDTAEEARAAVAACRYVPSGIRGAGWAGSRSSHYGMIKDYQLTASERLLVVLQIETVKAVENLDEILKVEGIDVVFIGAMDLTGSAGHLADRHHPEVVPYFELAERKILDSGIPMGTVPLQRSWQELFDAGYAMVNSASDTAILRDRSLADVGTFRQLYGRTG